MSSVSVRLQNAKFGVLFASAAGRVDEVVTTVGGWRGYNPGKQQASLQRIEARFTVG
jgi:hypothetical protein